MARVHRRAFLQQSAAIGLLAAAPAVRGRSINEKLNLGFIGLGGRGTELLRQFGRLPDVRVSALCDVDKKRLNSTAKKHREASKHSDLRKLLDDPDVDAVVIATCNHWHVLAAIWACQAEKDVYVEKPLCHNHWEGQQLVKAAGNHRRVVQVGMQQRSDPLQDELKQFLHDEQELGPIKCVEVCRFGPREPIGKRSTPLTPPASIDYDLWLGPAHDEPIYRNNLHYDWHWNWNTGNGEMGNWGVHVLDDAVNVVLRDQVPYPKRVAAGGGRVAWDDAGQTPNVCFAYYDTGTIPIVFTMSNLVGQPSGRPLRNTGVETGYIIRCEDGYYAGGRGRGAAYDLKGKQLRPFKGDSGTKHPRNFVDAVAARDPGRLNCDVLVGHRSTAWCNLADIAVRVGQPYASNEAMMIGQPHKSWSDMIRLVEQHLAENSVEIAAQLRLSPILDFDATQECFVGHRAPDANQLLRRQFRQQFEVPTIA
jgi:predicted dehydrogenase